MSKKSSSSYLSPERVLSPREFAKYQDAKAEEAKNKYQRTARRIESKRPNFVTRAVGAIRSPARALYGPQSNSRGSGFGRGRPVGSVKYRDPQTGQKIGVYEYRKLLNARLRGQRQEQFQSAQFSPAEQQAIAQVRMQQRQSNYPAGYDYYDKVVGAEASQPRITGRINVQGFTDEINAASNLVE